MSAQSDAPRVNIGRVRRHGLLLQQKAWIITAGVLAALAALLALGIDGVFRKSFSRMEDQWVIESIRRVHAAVESEIDGLARTTRDYATWTESYDFLGAEKASYIENNLLPATFTNLQIEAFLMFDVDGNLKMGRSYDGTTVSETNVADLTRRLAASARAAVRSGKQVGVIDGGGRLALFAVLPILRDDGSGPPRGALAQIRYLSPERLERIRHFINLNVSLERTTGHPRKTREAEAFTTTYLDDQVLLARVPIQDVNGDTVAEWTLKLPRQIHLQGMKARIVFYVVMCVLIVSAALLIGWMLRSMVIARLEALHDAVDRVGATSDLSLRLPLDGSDELTRLAQGINQMLSAIARAESDRVLAEEERQRLNTQLQQAQKLEAIGTLTGGLAHDFNNLLTSIQGSTTLLRLESPPDVAGEPHLRRIEQAAAQAAGLVRQMMAFGRRSPVAFTHVHLGEIVRDALQLLRPSLPRGIEFHFRNEAVNDTIYADATQLQQVIVNLATNSGHAMANGNGQLSMHIMEVSVPVPSRPETLTLNAGTYLQLSVTDTGCGIPEDVLPRIFEPFYTTKPVGSGTGLGLAVVHGIITHHYGAIGVQSEVGVGTTIFVHFPQVQSEVAEQENAAPVVRTADSSLTAVHRLLLVDDDAMVRETLEAGLRREGFEVCTAASAARALEVLRQMEPPLDAMITDQMMPGMTGTELGEIVRNEFPGLPMVLLTGYASALNEPKVKAMGFAAMLMKPVSMDVLARTVRTACSKVAL